MDREQIKDLNQVEGADLSRDMKLIATTTLSSLHYLKALSFRLGVSIEDITADQIINECSAADVEIRNLRRRYDMWLLGSPE